MKNVDINIENRVKEISKEVLKRAINESVDKELVKKLSKEVAKEAIFDIVNSKKDRRYHNTKLLMENYKTLKEHVNGIKDEISLKFEFRDEDNIIFVKSEYLWLESIAKSEARTIEMMEYVDAKIKYLVYEYENKDQYEIIDSFMMFYIDGETDEMIREKYTCGQHTPRRWREKILKELSILLWGVDAIQMQSGKIVVKRWYFNNSLKVLIW